MFTQLTSIQITAFQKHASIFALFLAMLVGNGSFAMASDTFDPYAPVNKFSKDFRSGSHQLRDLSQISDQEQERLAVLAVQQARIWADTILEGDFEAAGDTRVDQVQGVFSGDQLLAYHVTFSETAWSTAQCNYDPANKSTLEACVSGRIVESMYVTPDFTTSERDERNFAHFVK